jgi:bifunctional non-homologous end joining protein LigD
MITLTGPVWYRFRSTARAGFFELKWDGFRAIAETDGVGKVSLPRIEWLVNRGPQKGTLIYYVFDLLSLDGKDLRQVPLEKRKARLAKLLKNHRRLIFVDHVEGHGLGMFAGAMALGMEGILAKDAKSP